MEAGTARTGQEGSRWINERPTGEEVAKWFEENVNLPDEKLEHDDYVQGITLIPNKMKEKVVVEYDGAKPVLDDIENLVFTPYAKVETRVKCFWDWMRLNEGWLGVIEPVTPLSPVASLPPGFGRIGVTGQDGKVSNYLTCSMRVKVYEADSIERHRHRNTATGDMLTVVEGKEVFSFPPATKAVPMLGRFGPDDNAVMKAETGAVGRALGFAGILVVPGSGIATAEDMQEALALEGTTAQTAPAEAAAVLPESDDSALRQRIGDLVAKLGEVDAARLEQIRDWMNERDELPKIPEMSSVQLRGVIGRLEKALAEAKAEQAEASDEG